MMRVLSTYQKENPPQTNPKPTSQRGPLLQHLIETVRPLIEAPWGSRLVPPAETQARTHEVLCRAAEALLASGFRGASIGVWVKVEHKMGCSM